MLLIRFSTLDHFRIYLAKGTRENKSDESSKLNRQVVIAISSVVLYIGLVSDEWTVIHFPQPGSRNVSFYAHVACILKNLERRHQVVAVVATNLSQKTTAGWFFSNENDDGW